jgi:hypothetical protein
MPLTDTDKSMRYMQRMLDLGLQQVRVLVPVDTAAYYLARADYDRADYLHWLAEEAPDDDPRLALLAGMNKTKPLSTAQRCALVSRAKNAAKAERIAKDMDALQAALWEALRSAEHADTPSAQTRARARASVAAMDYRRLRDDLERA